MRACSALAYAARAHETADIVYHKCETLTGSELEPLLQGGFDQDIAG